MLAYSGVAHAGTMLLAIADGWHDTEPHGAQDGVLYYMAPTSSLRAALRPLAWMESEGGAGDGRVAQGLSAAPA